MHTDPAEEVRRVARAVAAVIAPALERQLIEVYGRQWLTAVNERRRQEGYPAGWSLADHRFCLAVFGHDPATVGWAHETLRQSARKLGSLATCAAHDKPLTGTDVAQARQIEKTMRSWTGAQKYHVAGGRSRRGRDVETDVTLSFVEALRGVTVPLRLRGRDRCGSCQGTGRVLFILLCSKCHGTGDEEQVRTVHVRFPAGVNDGQRVKVIGRGQPGLTGGAPGDLYIRVQLRF